MHFVLLFPEKPRSLQAKANRLQNYKGRISSLAKQIVGATPKLTGDLYVRIVWFYSGKPEGDIDNIIKPILDALKGVVYVDDKFVVKCASEKVDQNDAILSTTNIDTGVYNQIYSIIAGNLHPNFVYIEIGILPARQVVFGPVI